METRGTKGSPYIEKRRRVLKRHWISDPKERANRADRSTERGYKKKPMGGGGKLCWNENVIRKRGEPDPSADLALGQKK